MIFIALIKTSKDPLQLPYELKTHVAGKQKTIADYEAEAAHLALGIKTSRLGADFLGAGLFQKGKENEPLLLLDAELKPVEAK